MLSFEISAIDIVLVIAVVILLILYLKKFSASFPEEKYFRKIEKKEKNKQMKQLENNLNYSECPRGFGDIRVLGEDNVVSEKCLGCYKIVECYSGNKTDYL